MNANTVKLLALLGYGAFVLVSKAVKASRQSRVPGGMPIPQGAPRKPHPMAGQVTARPRAVARAAPASVVPVRNRPPVRRVQARLPSPPRASKAAPKPKAPESPLHDAAHPVETRLKPVETEAAALPPLAALLTGRDDLRKGILLSEVLGPPLALR